MEEAFELEDLNQYDDSDLDDDYEQYLGDEDPDAPPKSRFRRFLSYIGSSGYMGGVYGSASFSLPILVALTLPPIIVMSNGKTSYFWVGQFAMLPLIAYVLMSIPVAVGALFAWGLRTFGPLNGYPFHVGAVSLFPMIRNWGLTIRVVVYDAAFGNPPGKFSVFASGHVCA